MTRCPEVSFLLRWSLCWIALAASSPLPAQAGADHVFDGTWVGAVGSDGADGAEVAVRLLVAASDARLSVPHFGWYDLTGNTTATSRSLDVEFSVYGQKARLRLTRQGDTLDGSWSGWGVDSNAELRRSAMPQIVAEDGSFESRGRRFERTLLLPSGDGPFPAIVWTHGSGPITRADPLYRSLAAWVAEHGIASLIYDKRPPTPDATMEVLAQDAVAAALSLRDEERIREDLIGVGGLSQGGWIAPMAAASSLDIGFVVGLSAPGVSPGEQNLFNQRNRVLAAGFGEQIADEASDVLRSIYGYLRSGQRRGEVAARLEACRTEPWFAAAHELPIWHRQGLPPAPWRHVASLDFDPGTAWRRVRVPVVCVAGAGDVVVPPVVSRERIAGWLDETGNDRRLLLVIPDTHHDLKLPPHEPWQMGATPAEMNAVVRFVHSLANQPPATPPTRRTDDAYELHGQRIPDPFRWLEREGNERDEWARAQNRTLLHAFADEPFVDATRDRILALNDYQRAPVPREAGNRWFHLEREAGAIHGSIRVRAAGKPRHGKTERTLVDPRHHPASPGHTVALGSPLPSPDGAHVLYAASSESMQECIRVVRVSDGQDLADDAVPLSWWPWRAVWLRDGSGFAYARDGAIRVHRLGEDQAADATVFAAPPGTPTELGVRAAADGSMLFVTAFDPDSDNTEVHLVALGDGRVSRPLNLPPEAHYQVIGKRGSRVLVYTTLDAPGGRIIALDLSTPDELTPVVPEWRAPVLDGNHPIRPTAAVCGDHIVLMYADEGRLVLRAHALDGALEHEIVHGQLGFNESGLIGSPVKPVVRYDVQSMFDPGSAYELDLQAGDSKRIDTPLAPFDPKEFELSRHEYRGLDGTRVPITLGHRRGIVRDGTHPVLMLNSAIPGVVPRPHYLPELHVWIETGGIVALPSARGCAEYGDTWEEAGSGIHRTTSLDDLAAASRWLVRAGYSRADRIVLKGSSSLGPATAATVLRHPFAFGALLLPIPRADLLAYRTLVPAYGDYEDPDELRAMLDWMPLTAARPGWYPPALVQVGSLDRIAPPYHGYKLAATLQSVQLGHDPIYLQVVEGVGHALGHGVPQRSATEALHLAFAARSVRLVSER